MGLATVVDVVVFAGGRGDAADDAMTTMECWGVEMTTFFGDDVDDEEEPAITRLTCGHVHEFRHKCLIVSRLPIFK